MIKKIVIPVKLPSLNNYIDSCRSGRYAGGNFKRRTDDIVIEAIESSKIKPIKNYPIGITIKYYEDNRRRDPDNIVSAKKYILDGLVSTRIIDNDGWKQIKYFNEEIHLDKDNPRVEVYITEEEKEKMPIKAKVKVNGGK